MLTNGDKTNDNQTVDNGTNPNQAHPVTPKKRRRKTGNIGRHTRPKYRLKSKTCTLEPPATPLPKSPSTYPVTPSPPLKSPRPSYRPTPNISIPTPKCSIATRTRTNLSTDHDSSNTEQIDIIEYLSLCSESEVVFGNKAPKVRNLSIAYIYQHCYGAPPPEDWDSTNGTIMRLAVFF